MCNLRWYKPTPLIQCQYCSSSGSEHRPRRTKRRQNTDAQSNQAFFLSLEGHSQTSPAAPRASCQAAGYLAGARRIPRDKKAWPPPPNRHKSNENTFFTPGRGTWSKSSQNINCKIILLVKSSAKITTLHKK